MNKEQAYAQDVRDHQARVSDLMDQVINELCIRQTAHDESKFSPQEFPIYQAIVPDLKKLEFGSAEYREKVKELGPALQHHYRNNRHHPEHFEDKIRGMNLIDLVEMICDCIAASEFKGDDPKDGFTGYLFQKHGITEPLASIILNTIDRLDRK